MTVQLSSLRITAEMEAQGYLSAMAQKVAADKAGAASSEQVAGAVTKVEEKSARAMRTINAMAAAFVPGTANVQKFEVAISRLNRQMEMENGTAEQHAQILQGLYSKYGLAANASDLMANGATKLAPLVADLNSRYATQADIADKTTGAIDRMKRAQDAAAASAAASAKMGGLSYLGGSMMPDSVLRAQQAALDSVRAKYVPLFEIQQRYLKGQTDIAAAQKMGAISANEAMEANLRLTRVYEDQRQKLEGIAQAQKDSAQSKVNSQLIVPNRGEDIAAYGAELDDIRAKYDPLFAAQRKYREDLHALNQALRVGAIDQNVYGTALSALKGDFAGTVSGLRGTKSAVDEVTAATARSSIEIRSMWMELSKLGREQLRAIPSGGRSADDAGKALGGLGYSSGSTISDKEIQARRAAILPLVAAEQELAEATARYDAALKNNIISEKERNAMVAQAKSRFQSQETEMKKATEAHARQERGIQLNAYAWQNLGFQVNDVVTSLASGISPFQTIAQQGGQVYQILSMHERGVGGALKDIRTQLSSISPQTAGLVAIGTALALAAAGALSYANAQRDVRLSILGAGQAAGVTAEQINEIAERVSSTGTITVGTAREVMTIYARAGVVMGGAFESGTLAAEKLGRAMGKDSAAAAESLNEKMKKLSTGGIEEIQQQTRAFSEKQLDLFNRLSRTGDEVGLQDAVFRGLIEHYRDINKELTTMDRIGLSAKNVLTGLVEEASSLASDVGKAITFQSDTPTPRQMLSEAERRVRVNQNLGIDPTLAQQEVEKWRKAVQESERITAEAAKTAQAKGVTSNTADRSYLNIPGETDLRKLDEADQKLRKFVSSMQHLYKGIDFPDKRKLMDPEIAGEYEQAIEALQGTQKAMNDVKAAGGALNVEQERTKRILEATRALKESEPGVAKATAEQNLVLAQSFGRNIGARELATEKQKAYQQSLQESQLASEAESRATIEGTKTSTAQADALKNTGRSVEYVTAQRTVMERLANKNISQAELEKKTNEELQSRLAAADKARAESVRSMSDEQTVRGQTIATIRSGQATVAQAQAQERGGVEIMRSARDAAEATGEQRAALEDTTRRLAAAQKVQLAQEQEIRTLGLQEDEDRRIEYLEKEISLIGESADVRARELGILQARQNLERQGLPTTGAAPEKYINTAGTRSEMEEFKRQYERMTQDIGQTITGVFDQLFTDSTATAQEVLENFAKSWARIGSRLVEENLIMPMLSGKAGALGSMDFGGLIDSKAIGESIAAVVPDAMKDSFGKLLTPGPGGGILSTPLFKGAAAVGVGAGIGYSTQSPLMGTLGGGLAGLATGNPIMALLGAGSGLLGGLFGKSEAEEAAKKAMQEQMLQYAEALKDSRVQIERLSSTFRGEGVGSVQQQIDEALTRAREAIETASKGGDQALADRLSTEFTGYANRLRTTFMLSFEDTLDNMRGGEGLDSVFAQAAASVQTLGESLKGFVADAANLPFPDVNVAKARSAAIQTALDSLQEPKSLSDVEERLREIEGTGSALGQVLRDLGLSARDAADAIEARTQVALEELRGSFEDDIRSKINDVSGRGYLNELSELVAERDSLRQDARALGMSSNQVNRYFTLAAQDIVDGSDLAGAAFRNLLRQFPELRGEVQAAAEEIEEAAEDIGLASRIAGYRDRRFMAGLDTSNRGDALAAFDREALRERQALEEAGATSREIRELERALSAERLDIIRDFRRDALEEQKRETRERLAEQRAAAADRLAEQREEQREERDAAREARDRAAGYNDRAFAAGNDDSTLRGQLAAFNRDAERQRQEEIRAGGEAIRDLEKALLLERRNLIRDFNRDALRTERDRYREAREYLRDFSGSIKEYLADLKTGADSPLSPGERLATAQSEFDRLLGLAKTGDKTALDSITGASDTLLAAARDNFASGAEFQKVFQQVTSSLAVLPSQVKPEELIVSAIENMRDTLEKAVNAGPAATAVALNDNFTMLDTTMNGRLSKDELVAGLGPLATKEEQAAAKLVFDQLDLNDDKQLSEQELIRAASQSTTTNTGTTGGLWTRIDEARKASQSAADRIGSAATGGLYGRMELTRAEAVKAATNTGSTSTALTDTTNGLAKIRAGTDLLVDVKSSTASTSGALTSTTDGLAKIRGGTDAILDVKTNTLGTTNALTSTTDGLGNIRLGTDALADVKANTLGTTNALTSTTDGLGKIRIAADGIADVKANTLAASSALTSSTDGLGKIRLGTDALGDVKTNTAGTTTALTSTTDGLRNIRLGTDGLTDVKANTLSTTNALTSTLNGLPKIRAGTDDLASVKTNTSGTASALTDATNGLAKIRAGTDDITNVKTHTSNTTAALLDTTNGLAKIRGGTDDIASVKTNTGGTTDALTSTVNGLGAIRAKTDVLGDETNGLRAIRLKTDILGDTTNGLAAIRAKAADTETAVKTNTTEATSVKNNAIAINAKSTNIQDRLGNDRTKNSIAKVLDSIELLNDGQKTLLNTLNGQFKMQEPLALSGKDLDNNVVTALNKIVYNTAGIWSAVKGGYVPEAAYSSGGYTGSGGKYEYAGVVHRGEFVLNADTTRKMGLPLLNAMNENRIGGLPTISVPGTAAGDNAATNSLLHRIATLITQVGEMEARINQAGFARVVEAVEGIAASTRSTPIAKRQDVVGHPRHRRAA